MKDNVKAAIKRDEHLSTQTVVNVPHQYYNLSFDMHMSIS